MPTPSGLLKRGDIIVQIATGAEWKVKDRLGSDEIYGVRLTPHRKATLPLDSRQRGYIIMTEAPYWLKHGWEVKGA